MVADQGHARDLRRWAPDADAAAKVRLMREFDSAAVDARTIEIDDPYFGDPEAFDRCLIEVEGACRGIVEHVRTEVAEPVEPADSRT